MAPLGAAPSSKALQGWRTRIVSASLFIVGWADQLHYLDLGASLRSIGVPADKVGAVVIIMSVIMCALREITTTAAGKSP